MIELEVIVTGKVPCNELEWHEDGTERNVLYVTIVGPNPMTGYWYANLTHLSDNNIFWKDGRYFYRTSEGQVHDSHSLKGVPRKYRSTAVQIKYTLSKSTIHRTQKDGAKFHSEEELREYIFSDRMMTLIKNDIAPLYDKRDTPRQSYRTSL